MARMVSFIVLVVLLVAVAALFFKVMAGFILPLFLAVLLVIMFRPLHHWFVARLKGHDRWAAALTTVAIVLIFLIPLLAILLQGVSEAMALSRTLTGGASNEAVLDKIDRQVVARAVNDLNEQFGLTLSADEVHKAIVERLKEWLTPFLLNVVGLVVGLCIMIIGMYYFLADGPHMIDTIMRLSPLASRYETELIREFDTITRAVVLASVVSAVVQGILAGIGYYFAGLQAVFLLTVLTMLLAMVPFVGATSVWLPCSLWLYFHTPDGQAPVAAIALALYGVLVVSLVDNLIKPLILHGRSNIHPLLALLSILGGVKVLGPIGIFVGPMVVTFLHTVLLMLQKEIVLMEQPEKKAGAVKAAR